jgi:hypothetical protein
LIAEGGGYVLQPSRQGGDRVVLGDVLLEVLVDELVHSQLAAGEGAKTDALQGVLENGQGLLTGREASAAATVAVRVVVTEAPKAVALVELAPLDARHRRLRQA